MPGAVLDARAAAVTTALERPLQVAYTGGGRHKTVSRCTKVVESLPGRGKSQRRGLARACWRSWGIGSRGFIKAAAEADWMCPGPGPPWPLPPSAKKRDLSK